MKSIIFNRGIQLVLISIVITMTLYFIDPKLITNPWASAFQVILYPVFLVLAVKDYKDQNEGYVDFGQAFLVAWLTGCFGALLGSIFTYVLYNFIDPSLLDLLQEAAESAMEMARPYMGEEAFENAMAQQENQDFMGFSQIIISLITNALVGLIPSLIIALIMKNERSDWS